MGVSVAVDPARRLAYDVLHEVGASGGYSHIVLGTKLRDADLDQRQAGFATDVVNGTLRNQLFIDAVIGQCSSRPLGKIDPRVLDVLRMGIYQLLFADTDSYAAVNESVDLAVSVSGPGPKGFTNAVLRAASKHDLNQWRTELVPGWDSGEKLGPEELSTLTSHPVWIVNALRDSLGRSRQGELRPLLEANNEAPDVTLVARPGRADVDELQAEGATPGRYSPYAYIAPSGKVARLEQVRTGAVGVQDEGSQLVTLALANAPVEGEDSKWLDLCAGPGGKAALLAALAAERGAQVTGVELHDHRAKLVERAAKGPGFAGVVVGDALDVDLDGQFDRVLVDAPCTGLGVLRRRPDLRWRRSPSDLADLTKLQADLLNNALDRTRAGGVVAYVTCSPHIAETDLLVSAVLKKRDDVSQEDARTLFPNVPDLGPGPAIRLWPHLHDTDGMYLALLRKQ